MTPNNFLSHFHHTRDVPEVVTGNHPNKGAAVTSKITDLAGRNSWLICLGAVAILCSLTLWNGWDDYVTTLREAQARQDSLARIAETNLSSSFAVIDRFLTQIAYDCDGTPLDSPSIQKDLLRLLPLIPDAHSIVIANKEGTLVSSTTPNITGTNVTARSYFSQLMAHPETSFYISEPFDTTTNKRLMVISRLIFAPDGSPRGVIGISIQPEFVTNTLATARPGFEGSVVLFGLDYIIRSRIPEIPDTIGKSLKGLPVTEQFLSSNNYVEHYRVKATLDGNERIVTFRRMKDPYNLVLTVSDSTQSIFTAWKRKSLLLGMLTFAGVTLIIILGYSSNRYISATAKADAALIQRDILFETVLKNLPVKVCARDKHGKVIYQCESCKVTSNTLSSYPVGRMDDYESALRTWNDIHERACAGESTTMQNALYLEDGEQRLFESHYVPIFDGDNIIGTIGVDIDVTDYKSIESRLLHALSEKDVMLKEIHHRVKNNLQIIMSLINLQNDASETKHTCDTLTQTYERIRTIALVHEHLYKSGDFGFVHISEYIPNLIQKITTVFGRDGLMVSINLNIDSINLSIDRAIPFGLIVNELVMNSFKHAYGDQSRNELHVTFCRTESGFAELSVSDNGPGLPASYDLNSDSTLGMRLVNILVQQLRGVMHYSGEYGAHFRIVVPIQ